jgi:hypothetical protein
MTARKYCDFYIDLEVRFIGLHEIGAGKIADLYIRLDVNAEASQLPGTSGSRLHSFRFGTCCGSASIDERPTCPGLKASNSPSIESNATGRSTPNYAMISGRAIVDRSGADALHLMAAVVPTCRTY